MFLGLTLVLLVIFAGIGIDMGRSQMVRNKMQNAMDAAALAAAAVPEPATIEERTIAARRYYKANYPRGYMGGDIDENQIGVSIVDGKIVVSGGTQVATTYMRVNNGQENVKVDTKTIVAYERLKPAAVDVAIGLDGSCGNENNRKYGPMEDGMFALLHSMAKVENPTLPDGVLPHGNVNKLKYASASWDGKSSAGQNGSHDYFNTTGDLNVVYQVAGSRDRNHGDNGTSMPSVIREIVNRHYVYSETRPPEAVARKLKVAVLFQGSAHRNEGGGGDPYVRNPESLMPQLCDALKQRYDGVYTIAVGGPTNNKQNCGGQSSWGGGFSLQNCSKAIDGVTYPAYSQVDRYALPQQMRLLGEQLGKLETLQNVDPVIEE